MEALLFAYDTKGRPVDITGRTIAEALDGAPSHHEFGHNETERMLWRVRETRTGTRHDWDADTHETARVAYFVVSYGTMNAEAFITPIGQRAQVEGKTWFPDTCYVTNLNRDRTFGPCRNGTRRLI